MKQRDLDFEMTKVDYLDNANVSEFVKYLAKLIKGGDFEHHYQIQPGPRNAAWIEYNDGSPHWRCDNLNSATNQYFWAGRGFEDNNQRLRSLSEKLKKAVDGGDPKRVLCTCIEICEWGGIPAGALTITKSYCNEYLIESLKNALAALTPKDRDGPNLVGFNKEGEFIINATYTKIYSLLSESPFIIYDSRVAAALGLLVKKHWLAKRENNEPLPDCLKFVCLDGRAENAVRCASDPEHGISFKKAQTHTHALWNMRANWIIEKALDEAGAEGGNTIARMREVESALFMIGYSV